LRTPPASRGLQCFFAISGVLPRDEAIRRITQPIEKA
jgi:hypothetical protein